MLTKGVDLEFKDVDLKQGIVKGQFAKHNVKDLDNDISEFGTFAKSIQERGPQGKKLIKFMIDHDKTKVPGVIHELWETSDGGFYTMKSGSHNLGVDFIKMVESGIFNQHSYGYNTIKEAYDQNRKANILKEQKLLEVSAIQFLGANPETTYIDLKSQDEIIEQIARFKTMIEKMKKFVRNTDASDETIILIEKSMHDLIENDIKSLTALLKPTGVTLNDKGADEVLNILSKLSN